MAEGVYHKYDRNTMEYSEECEVVLKAIKDWIKDVTGEKTIAMYNGPYESEVCKGITITIPEHGTHEFGFLWNSRFKCKKCNKEFWTDTDDEGDDCPECENSDNEYLKGRLEMTIGNQVFYPRNHEDMCLITLNTISGKP